MNNKNFKLFNERKLNKTIRKNKSSVNIKCIDNNLHSIFCTQIITNLAIVLLL